MTHADELLAAAHEYIDRGLRVLALTGKQPNTVVHRNWSAESAFASAPDHGPHPKDSYLYEGCPGCELPRAFRHPNTTGIGILTGPVYYVVDIDGEEGARQWRDLVGDEYIPDRWAAKTGRGLHLWVADYEAWPTAKLGPKLDFKGVGGYVAAPPSIHPDGHHYEWLLAPDDKYPPMRMPEPLRAELVKRRALREQAMVGKAMRKPVPVEDRIPGLIYNDVSHQGVIDAVRNAGDGNRNNLLFWAAATLQEEGAPKEEFDALLAAAVESGLPRYEARRTITSAIRSIE
jgi:hypothetical protein